MSCGCKQPNENHDDPRNITMDDLQQAADAAGVSIDEAARNIAESAGGRSPVGVGQAATRRSAADERQKQFGEEEPTQREF
jgi:hypothetical protein